MNIDKTTYLNKQQSFIIKAVAIIIMLIHHFFTFPSFYIEGIYYDNLEVFAKYLCSPTKICVSIFAFLTGWAYFYNKNKTVKYSLNKIIRFLINYWLVCIPLLILAYYLGVFNWNLKNVLLELIGRSKLVMVFCWYVSFYIISMLILPFIYKIFDKNLITGLIVGCIFPIILIKIILKFASNFMFISDLIQFFPCIAIGYLAAKYQLFTYLEYILKKLKLNNCIVFILIIVISLIGRYLKSTYDFIYSTLVIFSIIKLSNSIILNNRLMCFIGKQATNIWFLHCAFFSTLGTVLQPIAYFPKNPILVIVWVLCLCSIISVLINKCLIIIYKKLNL